MIYLEALKEELAQVAIVSNVVPMQNYMKNNFFFYGVKSPERKKVFRKVYKQLGLLNQLTYKKEILEMMAFSKREMNYCAIDLAVKCQKKYGDVSDIDYITKLITSNSWWDSVDAIVPKILGKYLQDYAEKREDVLNEYMASNNLWLHRSCILFQLKYKAKTDSELLFALCDHFSSSKEFFIQKAIGWVLREYAKTNPVAVYDYVDRAGLANLSRREANKHRR